MDIQPYQYVKRNTDPTLVVSTIVAAFALGSTLFILRRSGIAPLQEVAKIAKK